MEHSSPPGHLYLVGIGPGDPELITYKAGRFLNQTRVWAVPQAKADGQSRALSIAANQLETKDKTILELCFPMKKVFLGETVTSQLSEAWRASAEEVISYLDRGEDVAFPTLGDPSLYSTAFYLLPMILERRPETQVTVIPGITAMAACAAGINAPLALGNDVLAVVPAAFDDDRLRDTLISLDAVVLMKVHRKMDQLVELLTELELVDQAVLFERFGLPDQRVYPDIREALGKELHYFSTMLIRKKQVQV
ncbi:precorrin-2 C(20)-methyltransferase [Desulfogranum mediterraneum]|uniref:precorrin-2 C(20)-methyltransferase n=1 Tax=Desulfogranum mediterraneum TaxID=160661 RepID=UPI000427EC3D|nr:precorrin-2 C(20)-methyltransferase [Desulfogranum mediterraneum]